jgi:Cu-Zn family superoxide dismutase
MLRTIVMSLAVSAAVSTLAGSAFASSVRTELKLATPTGPGRSVGWAVISSSPKGAVIKLKLHDLPAGEHGLHLHENGTCMPAAGPDGKAVVAGAAGPHRDPGQSGHHMGPEGQGHLGDLPRIVVVDKTKGIVRETLLAPRLTDVAALKGHSLMIHASGDTYSDTPPLGGGGPRLACGVLK